MVPENFQTLNAVEIFIAGKLGTMNGETGHAADAALRRQAENTLPCVRDDVIPPDRLFRC